MTLGDCENEASLVQRLLSIHGASHEGARSNVCWFPRTMNDLSIKQRRFLA